MQVPVLGHVMPPVGVDGGAARVIRQRVQRTAVDHAVGVFALRTDVQAVHRPVLLHGLQFKKIMAGKGIFPQPQLL